MSDYALVGKKGTGKSSGAVIIMRKALLEGRRVATNLNLHLDKLTPRHCRASAIRIPDKPTAFDLFGLGSGNPGIVVGADGQPRLTADFDEAKNGVLVLDEMGTWLNARSFQDKERMPVLDWLVHARKWGWDVYYIMQNVNQVDRQLRESLIEYVIRFHRVDKIAFPVITPLIKFATAYQSKGTLPRFHIGVMRLGVDPAGIVCDRMSFTGKSVHAGYDTTQVFQENYPHGTFSYLSHWHLEGYKHQVSTPGWILAVRNLAGLFRPKVRMTQVKNRRAVMMLYQRERDPEKRQRVLEALYRQERRAKRIMLRNYTLRSSRSNGKDSPIERAYGSH